MLFPDYQNFFEINKWGDPDILIDSINLCKQSATSPINRIAIEEMLLKLDPITPDTEDFGGYDGSYALNACVAVYETLQFLLDKEHNHIYDIGTCYSDTIYFKVLEEGDLTEEQSDKSPLVIEARRFLFERTKGGF